MIQLSLVHPLDSCRMDENQHNRLAEMRKVFVLILLTLGLFLSVQRFLESTLEKCLRGGEECEKGYQNPSLIEDRKWGLESPLRFIKKKRSEKSERAFLTKWVITAIQKVSLKAPLFGSVQRAVWTGDLSRLPFWLIQKYRERGLLPVLALSGQHVSSLSLVFATICVGLWRLFGKPRGYFYLALRLSFRVAVALFLLGLAPNEMSMVRTTFCSIVLFLIHRIPVHIDRPYLVLICFLGLLICCPDYLWSKGFVLSAHGALGVILSSQCFLEKQIFRRSIWLLIWLIPFVAFFFSSFLGTWFWLQWGMGWIWDQVFLPVFFLLGFLVFVLPVGPAVRMAEGAEKVLEAWLNWESTDVVSSNFWVYRPTAWEVLLFLLLLVALACWNREHFQRYRK